MSENKKNPFPPPPPPPSVWWSATYNTGNIYILQCCLRQIPYNNKNLFTKQLMILAQTRPVKRFLVLVREGWSVTWSRFAWDPSWAFTCAIKEGVAIGWISTASGNSGLAFLAPLTCVAGVPFRAREKSGGLGREGEGTPAENGVARWELGSGLGLG